MSSGQAATEGLDLLTLPPDQYQRYGAVAEIAGSLRTAKSKPQLHVLGVGGFAMTPSGRAMVPLAQFLPSDFTVTTDLTDNVLPNYIRADGAALPFRSDAFQLVVTCDPWNTFLSPAAPPSWTSCFAWQATAWC